jgi:hypothetical protein
MEAAAMKNDHVIIIIGIVVAAFWLTGGLKQYGINPPAGINLNLLSAITTTPTNLTDTHSGPYCGDAWCDANENMVNCPADCGAPSGVRKYGAEFKGSCDTGQVCTGLVSADYVSCKDLEGTCTAVKSGTSCFDSTHKYIGECCWC